MCANIGVIIGPILGGVTSDPVANYPALFGGNKWLERFPYSPPNLLSAIFLFNSVLLVFFGLEEVKSPLLVNDKYRLTFFRPIRTSRTKTIMESKYG